ncbi:STAS domain-containing protein [Streptomyces sp. DSM 44917]|uniref:Anti-sigma factor antagonist n=1 Tax=Streptomyces boetiae TaxID=3075541 RepID=A0ABU2LA44_9ACTN|nr:STAS domain-containing protein [Streptomyces sp. DSM 44917]MDT0308440.1 STAS domain-containing protein [Streptomyces sp. DSM 44917]
MPNLPSLHVSRRDRAGRTLLTLSGEIDLASAPLLRHALHQCVGDGALRIEVDVAGVTFCDCSGVNVFLVAARRTATAGGALRLHRPSSALARLFGLTGAGSLLAGAPPPFRPPRSGARTNGRCRPGRYGGCAVKTHPEPVEPPRPGSRRPSGLSAARLRALTRWQAGPAVLRALVLDLGARTPAVPDGLGHDARTQRP